MPHEGGDGSEPECPRVWSAETPKGNLGTGETRGVAEERQSPERVGPMRVCKTKPMKHRAPKERDGAEYSVASTGVEQSAQMSRQHLRETEKGRDSSREDLSHSPPWSVVAE